jgi:hypothetical protein
MRLELASSQNQAEQLYRCFAGMAEHGDFVQNLTSITSALASPQSARAGSEQLHELLNQQHPQPCLILAHDAGLLQRLCDGVTSCLEIRNIRTVQLTTVCIYLLLQFPDARSKREEKRFQSVMRLFLGTQVINSTARATRAWLTPAAGTSVQGPGHQRAGACSCVRALSQLLVAHEENNSSDDGIAPVALEPDTAAELSEALLQEVTVQAELLEKEMQLLQPSMAQLQLLPCDEQLFWPCKIDRQEYCALLLDLLGRLAKMVKQTTLLLMPPTWGSSLSPPAAPPPPAAAGPSTGSAHASAAAERYMALLLQLAAPGPLADDARGILSSCLFDLPAESVSPTVARLLRDCPGLVRWLAEGLRPPQLRDLCRQPGKYKGMSPADARKQVNEARQFKIAELLGSVKLVEQLLSMAWREVRQGPAARDSDGSSITTSGSSPGTTANDVAAGSGEGPARLGSLAPLAPSPSKQHQVDPAVHPSARHHHPVQHAAAGGSRDVLQHAAPARQLDGHHIVVKQEPQLQPDVAIPELAQALLEWQIPERVSALQDWAKAEGRFKGAGAGRLNSTLTQLKQACGMCLDVIWAAGLPKPRPLVEHVSQQEAVAQSGAQAVGGRGNAPPIGRKRAGGQEGSSKTKKGRGPGDGATGLGAGRDVPAEENQHNEGDASGNSQHMAQVRALRSSSRRPVTASASSADRAGLQQPGRGRGTGHGRTSANGKRRGGGSAEPQAAAGAVGQPLLGMPLLAGEPLSHEQRNSYPASAGTQQELQGAHPTLHDPARAAASWDSGEAQRSEAAAAPEGAGYTAAGELQLAMLDEQQHSLGHEGVPQAALQASADVVLWQQGPPRPWSAARRAHQPGSFAISPDGAGPSQPAGTAGAGISGSGTGGHNR